MREGRERVGWWGKGVRVREGRDGVREEVSGERGMG